jgi:nitrogen-specific signal transduction histidine kinase
VLDKLFVPFFTTKPTGTGLGLAVSQKIVEEHRGMIHVERGADDTTSFVVDLPRRFVAAYETWTPERREGEDTGGCG